MKQWIALCLMLAMVITCFAGCGDRGNDYVTVGTVPLSSMDSDSGSESQGKTDGGEGEDPNWIGVFPGKGTSKDPFRIGSARDLWTMAEKVNAEDEYYTRSCYILTADIDLGGELWTSIGDGYLDSVSSFRGSFDGDGHKISGLNIRCEDGDKERYYGLFGFLNSESSIRNLTIVASQIDCGGKSGANVGALAGGTEYDCTIENCHVAGDVSVSGSYTTGGLVGEFSGKMMGCTNEAAVTGSSDVGQTGGLVGTMFTYSNGEPATIQDCKNTGSVHAEGDAGGVVGSMLEGIVVNSANEAPISGKNGGGIAGFINAAQINGTVSDYLITDCTNSGQITAAESGGGIAGETTVTTGRVMIYKCTNTAPVMGKDMGGILGSGRTSTSSAFLTVSECGNLGTVSNPDGDGTLTAGGIVASVTGEDGGNYLLVDCYNDAAIDAGKGRVGGILGTYLSAMGEGYTVELTVESCENKGLISGGPMGVGGIIGEISTADAPTVNLSLICCSNSGDLFARTAAVRMGGMVGVIEPHHCVASFAGCVNSGNMTCEAVTVTEGEEWFGFAAAMGGILGYAGINGATLRPEDDCGLGGTTVVTFEGCENTGTMTPENDKVQYYIDPICGLSVVGTEIG